MAKERVPDSCQMKRSSSLGRLFPDAVRVWFCLSRFLALTQGQYKQTCALRALLFIVWRTERLHNVDSDSGWGDEFVLDWTSLVQQATVSARTAHCALSSLLAEHEITIPGRPAGHAKCSVVHHHSFFPALFLTTY
jgi:hypothetical protein